MNKSSPRRSQIALAIGLVLVAPIVTHVEPVYAQATKTIIGTTVKSQASVTVLTSGTSAVTTTVQNNTVTRTLSDGSVVRETTPITYTITTTPQTIRTDTIEVTTVRYSDNTTSTSQRVVSSVVGQRQSQSQTGVRGAVQTVVVSGPTKVTASTTTTTATGPVLDPKTFYQSPNVGTPSAVPSSDPAFYRTIEANNKTVSIVGAEHAYARGWTGKGSTVLIMDTGVNANHPDLAGKIKYQRDFTNTSIADTNGHGTHIAGIVAANRDGQGTHGVAFDANLAIAKIATGVNRNIGAANSAMAWASQYNDVVVASLSATVNYSRDYQAAMRQISPGVFVNNHQYYGGKNYYNLETPNSINIPRNMVMTVSAGNSNLGYVQSPAVFAAATDAQGNLVYGGRMLVVGNWNDGLKAVEGAKAGHVCKDFSNNICNDRYKISDFYILAPGSGVVSTSNTTGYRTMSGTSQAAPVVASAVAIINQLWPYMTPENQAQVLLKTANKNLPNYDVNVHGQGLLDLDKATRPIGNLGISTTGRTGAVMPISGSINVTGLSGSAKAALSSVSVVDELQRDYKVDLSPMVNSRMAQPTPYMAHAVGQSWSSKYAGWANMAGGVTVAGGYMGNTSVSIDSQALSSRYEPLRYQFTVTQTAYNPWINFNGMWGTSRDATTLEYSAVYAPSTQGFWAQGGVMQTTGRYDYGMINRVTPIYSAYAMLGHRQDGVNLYAGIKPVAFAGSVSITVPTTVDADGTMRYQNTTGHVRNQAVGFVGTSYSAQWRSNVLSLTAMASQDGSYSGGVQYQRRF